MAATYLTAALIDYNPGQSSFGTTTPTSVNWVGFIGANVVWVLYYSIGLSTWLIPTALFWMCYVAVRKSRHLVGTRVTALVIGIVAMSGLTAMFESYKGTPWFPNALGGYVGIHLYRKFLADALGPFGTGLLLGTVYLFALLFVITRDIGSEIEDILTNFTAWKAARAARKAALIEEKAKRKEERAKQRAALNTALAAVPAPVVVGPPGSKKLFVARSSEDPLSRVPGRP
ncbi:MAG TPA: DNA translocase FtsK 4TM domain-containing protein, partial [Opitutaceae bacterium]